MKILEKEVGGSGKSRLVFTANRQEIELLYGVVRKAYLHTPRIIETTSALTRLKSMGQELQKAIKELKGKTSDAPRLFNSNKISEIPCANCNGELIEFTIPNDIWNKVIRKNKKESDREYLCIKCFFNELRKEINLP